MKSIFTFIISTFPVNCVRIFLYRTFFKYDIDYNSKVGMFNIIKCSELTMNRAQIGFLNQIIVSKLTLKEKAKIDRRNRIKNLNILSLDENALIRSENFIGAPAQGADKDDPKINFKNQNLYVGKDSAILRDHYLDVVNEIIIGNNVVFGGGRSEIWTHGFDVERNMLMGKVIFGNNIFIGSNCIFTKGVTVTNNVTVGPGSVIYKSITESGTYSTHEIRKIK